MRSSVWAFACACWVTAGSAAAQSAYFLDQFAPSEEVRAGWPAAQQVYESFLTTTEFVGRVASAQDRAVRDDLERICPNGFRDCQAYLRTHRSAVLLALPDNAQYWLGFWQLLEINPHTVLDSDQVPNYERLLAATRWWFFRDLAEDGRLDIQRALALQSGLNLWLRSHHTLTGRMTTIAMRGMAFDQMSFAMAQASRDRDEIALQALIQVLGPIALKDISYGKMFWMQREKALDHWHQTMADGSWQRLDFDALRFELSADQDPELLARLLSDPVALQMADSDVLAKHYVAQSTTPWTSYWSQGIRTISSDAFEVNFLGAVGAPAYNTYIAIDRHSSFYAQVHMALAEMYAGRVSPGLPARDAPQHWRWEWQTPSTAYPSLCLISETVHPSTKQHPADHPERMCIEYYDEKAVAASFY